jgi:5-methylcytosine-specific restriction endonuclease McrA
MAREIHPDLRKAVYERDNYSCRDCGHKGKPGKSKGSIQAHHIKPMAVGVEHTLGNLITVCFDCHRKRHHKGWLKIAKVAYA